MSLAGGVVRLLWLAATMSEQQQLAQEEEGGLSGLKASAYLNIVVLSKSKGGAVSCIYDPSAPRFTTRSLLMDMGCVGVATKSQSINVRGEPYRPSLGVTVSMVVAWLVLIARSAPGLPMRL